MIEIIGLIIAVYGICRLAQVVFEVMGQGKDDPTWKGLPFFTRFIVVAAISGVGILTLLVLTACLLFQGTRAGGGF